MLIGLIGNKGAGKDTFAAGLPGFINVKMADPLKEMLRVLLRMAGVSDNRVEQMIEGDLKEIPCEELCGNSPRYAMQTLGTEWRNMLGLDLWSKIWEYRVEQLGDVVCTDLRFAHEVEAVRTRGGLVVRIDRPTRHDDGDNHSSETELSSLPCDVLVTNAGSVYQLQQKAKALL